MLKFKYSTQVQIVIATMAIQYFIRQNIITVLSLITLLGMRIYQMMMMMLPIMAMTYLNAWIILSSEYLDHIRDSMRDDIVKALLEN